MTRERKAQVLTLGILGVALAVVIGQRAGWRVTETKLSNLVPKAEARPDPTPQDAIYAMLDAARTGNVKAYLASYAGPMETSLRQSIAETTEAGFAKYLRDTNASVKGIALSELQTLSDREVRVRVEYVYQDRNEAQFLFLRKGPDGWKIYRVDSAERVKTLVPYGTPVE